MCKFNLRKSAILVFKIIIRSKVLFAMALYFLTEQRIFIITLKYSKNKRKENLKKKYNCGFSEFNFAHFLQTFPQRIIVLGFQARRNYTGETSEFYTLQTGQDENLTFSLFFIC